MDELRNGRLSRIRSQHPSLAPLVDVALREQDFTDGFAAAYFADNNTETKKSLVLSTMLFGQPVIRKPVSADVLLAAHPRMARFIMLHPDHPLDRSSIYWREYLPMPFLSALGLSRPESAQFVRRFALEPRFGQLDVSLSVYPPLSGLKERDLSYLDPFVRILRLDDRPSRSTLQPHYFDTSVPALDLHNILRVALDVLNGDRQGGRSQNRIPRPLSHALGISILSIPQLLAAVDILGLAGHGLIDEAILRGSHSRLGLLATTASNSGNRFDALLPELPALLRRAVSLHLLDPARADLYAEGVSETRVGLFDTSFRFNVTRLLARGDRKLFVASPFQRFYDGIKREQFVEFMLAHFESVDPEYSTSLRGRVTDHPDLFTGIRARDLGNTLYLIHRHRLSNLALSQYLPSVAAYALGLPEPVHRGLTEVASYTPRKRGLKPPRRLDLPLLERLLSRQPVHHDSPDSM